MMARQPDYTREVVRRCSNNPASSQGYGSRRIRDAGFVCLEGKLRQTTLRFRQLYLSNPPLTLFRRKSFDTRRVSLPTRTLLNASRSSLETGARHELQPCLFALYLSYVEPPDGKFRSIQPTACSTSPRASNR